MIVSALVLFSGIATLTILMIRHTRDVQPSIDVTVGALLIAILFIVWAILAGSFYTAFADKPKRVSHNEIPNPPNLPAPKTPIGTTSHFNMNQYEMRTHIQRLNKEYRSKHV